MHLFPALKAGLILLVLTRVRTQDEYEGTDDPTLESTTTTTLDPIAQWVTDQRKVEKERARKILLSLAERKGPEHPLCDFYCDLFNVCVQNEEIRPICGFPVGCAC